jgi:hypothetical protein
MIGGPDRCYRVLCIDRSEILEERSDNANLLRPLARVILVHGQQAVEVISFLQLHELLPEQHLARIPGAVQVGEFAELIPVVKHVKEQGA